MVRAADNENWQRVFQMLVERSRWDLDNGIVREHLARSFDYIIDFLARDEAAEPFALDPSGDVALREAKRVRRAAMRAGGPAAADRTGRQAFELPPTSLAYAAALRSPLYAGSRAASS
jgi:hypothetical protein